MMNKLYIITGASGHLGSFLIKELIERNCKVRALYLPGEEKEAPDQVESIIGNVLDLESLKSLFDVNGYEETCLIHCAGIVSIATKENPLLYDANVNGTKNIRELPLMNHIDRVIHVSTVHAIKEEKYPEKIKETKDFSKDYVVGAYAKSKAEASRIVLEYADKGLNVSIVHPSGIIGPGDIKGTNHSVSTLKAMYKGTIPCSIKGGYDFVDVRDVVNGILLCEEKGRKGECYILSGHYLTVKQMLIEVNKIRNKKTPDIEIPASIIKVIAPLLENISILFGNNKPLLTPYSFYTLQSNGLFSNEKAKKELGYTVRDISETIKDTIM